MSISSSSSQGRNLLVAQSCPPPENTVVKDIALPITMFILVGAVSFLGLLSFYVGRYTFESIPAQADSDGDQQPSAPENTVVGRGIHPAVVDSCLPLMVYKVKASKMNNDCPICLDEFRDGEMVKSIPYCGHTFHPRCVDTWLSINWTCPMCRSFWAGPDIDTWMRGPG